MPSDADLGPPPDLTVKLAPDVLLHRGGRLLAGGAPFRVVKLTAEGATVVAGWREGDRVGEGVHRRRLARRLLNNGLLYPDPGPAADIANLSLVVPVRNSGAELARCLAAIRREAPGVELIVVDDASDQEQAIPAIAAAHGARLLKHPQPRNASAARNTGAAATSRPLIGFIDADVVVEPGCLHRLVAQFVDPALAAIAPRICPLSEQGIIGRYEARHSTLDRGPTPAPVAPGTAVPYVPSATLLIRGAAFNLVGGFEETLAMGEDVDLIWRLVGTGARVLYDPSARIQHDHRREARAFLRRRWQYADSIGALSVRHPQALYAFRTDAIVAATVGLALSGRHRLAVTLALLRSALMLRALGSPSRVSFWLNAQISRLMFVGVLRGLSHAGRRAWMPFLLFRRRSRRLLAAAILLNVLEADGPRTISDLLLGTTEDLIAALATITSCVRHRTARPLLIDLSPTKSLWRKPPSAPAREPAPTIRTDPAEQQLTHL